MGIFDEILAKRRQQSSFAPASMVGPLSVDESKGLTQWARDQRTSEMPDRNGWMIFWNQGVPFFRLEIACKVGGQILPNILQCADPVLHPATLWCWGMLDPGLQFVLNRTDLFRCLYFNADLLLLADRQTQADVCSFGRRIGPDGSYVTKAVWRPAEPYDVVSGLLLSWESSGPKWKFARERLCDIADYILAKSRQP